MRRGGAISFIMYQAKNLESIGSKDHLDLEESFTGAIDGELARTLKI